MVAEPRCWHRCRGRGLVACEGVGAARVEVWVASPWEVPPEMGTGPGVSLPRHSSAGVCWLGPLGRHRACSKAASA